MNDPNHDASIWSNYTHFDITPKTNAGTGARTPRSTTSTTLGQAANSR